MLKELKDKLADKDSYYRRDQEEPDPAVQYEKRKLIESLSKQIDDLKDEWRNAQATLEKTNWTEELQFVLVEGKRTMRHSKINSFECA